MNVENVPIMLHNFLYFMLYWWNIAGSDLNIQCLVTIAGGQATPVVAGAPPPCCRLQPITLKITITLCYWPRLVVVTMVTEVCIFFTVFVIIVQDKPGAFFFRCIHQRSR